MSLEFGGGHYGQLHFFSVDHTSEVHQEAKEHKNEPNGDVWDCTLIKIMKSHGDTVVNPIYDWTDSDVWEYIRQENIPVNPLYERGYTRVGCIGCPLAGRYQKLKEFEEYPKYKEAYIRAFQRMLDKRIAKGKQNDKAGWHDGQSVFDWWIEEYRYNTRGQMTLDDYV